MLERLFAAIANGPSLNCRPHSSRQRVDLVQFAKFKDVAPEQLLKDLLGEQRIARITARVPPPPPPPAPPGQQRVEASPDQDQASDGDDDQQLTPEEKAARQAWSDQQSLV